MELYAVRVLVLLFSVVVHEVAHGVAALRLGDDTAYRSGRLTLNPLPHLDPIGSVLVPLLLSLTNTIMFGWAKPVPVDPRRLRDPWNDQPKVAAAGPVSNLLLALVCAVLLGLTLGAAAAAGLADDVVTDEPSLIKFLFAMFQTGVVVNVVLALFNLVPLPPLDGSWILMRLLPPAARRGYAQAHRYGFPLVIGFLLMMRYTAFGRVVEAALMAVVAPYMNLAIEIAELFT